MLFGRTVPLFQICVKGKYFQGFVKNLIPMARFQLKMRRWLKKHRNDIDAIHACDLDTALFTAGFAKRKRIPFVYDVYDYYPDGHAKKGTGMYKALTRLDRKTEKRSDAVIVCTEERLTQIAPDMCKRVEVIQSVVNMIEDAHPARSEAAREIYEEITGHEWISVEEAERYLADPDSYEPPEEGETGAASTAETDSSSANGNETDVQPKEDQKKPVEGDGTEEDERQ